MGEQRSIVRDKQGFMAINSPQARVLYELFTVV